MNVPTKTAIDSTGPFSNTVVSYLLSMIFALLCVALFLSAAPYQAPQPFGALVFGQDALILASVACGLFSYVFGTRAFGAKRSFSYISFVLPLVFLLGALMLAH